jgi:glycogen operon protein
LGPGRPEPLGVTLDDAGANVAVFSANATAIELCCFDDAGEREVARYALPERTGDVFHGWVPGIVAGTRYGLRAHGPYAPWDGHRFNPAKLLVDPHAKAIDRAFVLHPAMLGQRPDGSIDETDSAAVMPKGVVTAPWPKIPVIRPDRPWSETIVYEMHVRGFTKLHEGVAASARGTFAALAHPSCIAHLKRIGVTSVELLPVDAAIDEPHLRRAGLVNYWGYNSIAWGVPDPKLAPGGMGEVRAAVAALHDAGIEVLLDVVLNHSGEGDANGPTLSLRGLDNATYYRTVPRAHDRYINDSGCGNVLALDRPPVLRLAMDALRTWATDAGVDGFRFDLATTLARRDDGFDPQAPFLAAMAQDPVLRDLKLIAEPWDIGPGGYQVGYFPPNWGEWNDQYRDTVRRFWRGDGGQVGALATRFAGSADLFARRRRPPSRSINFVTAHDGFTLADLVAYARKHNEANAEQNRDGTDNSYSWNHGVEGPASDARIVSARAADVRAMLATLLLSRGTPMLTMGDELGRSQSGNNNAYAQDTALTWLDWSSADESLIAFTTRLATLRREHPALYADTWLTGAAHDEGGAPDVEWLRPDGRPMTGSDWQTSQTLIASLVATGASSATGVDRVVIVLHAGTAPVEIALPSHQGATSWRLAITSADATIGAYAVGSRVACAARSVTVFTA